MRVRIARSEAVDLFHQLRMVDLRRLELPEENGDDLAESVSPALVLDLQNTEQRSELQRPPLGVRLREAIAHVGTFMLILALVIIGIPLQIPHVFVENVQKYLHCRANDLVFSLIWPVIPVPAYRIDSIGALKIFVYTEDHPPPHFHVVTDRYNAKFTISSCEFLGATGNYAAKHDQRIRKWHSRNVDVLSAAWVRTRPSTARPS